MSTQGHEGMHTADDKEAHVASLDEDTRTNPKMPDSLEEEISAKKNIDEVEIGRSEADEIREDKVEHKESHDEVDQEKGDDKVEYMAIHDVADRDKDKVNAESRGLINITDDENNGRDKHRGLQDVVDQEKDFDTIDHMESPNEAVNDNDYEFGRKKSQNIVDHEKDYHVDDQMESGHEMDYHKESDYKMDHHKVDLMESDHQHIDDKDKCDVTQDEVNPEKDSEMVGQMQLKNKAFHETDDDKVERQGSQSIADHKANNKIEYVESRNENDSVYCEGSQNPVVLEEDNGMIESTESKDEVDHENNNSMGEQKKSQDVVYHGMDEVVHMETKSEADHEEEYNKVEVKESHIKVALEQAVNNIDIDMPTKNRKHKIIQENRMSSGLYKNNLEKVKVPKMLKTVEAIVTSCLCQATENDHSFLEYVVCAFRRLMANTSVGAALEQIPNEIEEIGNMKRTFTTTHLEKFPDNMEESLSLLKPFFNELEEKYKRITQNFMVFRDFCDIEEKGRYFHLLGKLCNLFEEHALDALPYFEKAAKLTPNDIEIWNDLGDCYLSLGDWKIAKNCFHEALRREKNCWSYRSLSVVCRKEASVKGCDIIAAVSLGVDYAKEAIKIDPTDSYSWMILGNAYMALFLASKDDGFVPTKALQAYSQAEKNQGKFPELFFNKAIALLYAEDYTNCLEAFENAIRRDPVWRLAWEKYYAVKNYVMKVSEFCFSKGKVKLRKITQYILALNRESGSIINTKYNYKNLSDLTEGVNHGKIILGKVLWSCEIDDSFPFTFGIVDGLSNLIVVTVFNLKTGVGVKIGDSIAIPNPNYSKNVCLINNRLYRFLKIRVDSPRDISVNGRPLPDSHLGQSLTVTKCE